MFFIFAGTLLGSELFSKFLTNKLILIEIVLSTMFFGFIVLRLFIKSQGRKDYYLRELYSQEKKDKPIIKSYFRNQCNFSLSLIIIFIIFIEIILGQIILLIFMP